MTAVAHYALVTAAYWAFTVSDGALRMLVLLHFHTLGYSAVELSLLFLLYECCGMVTNLVGGWVAGAVGLRVTLLAGLGLQIFALLMLSLLQTSWVESLSVAYVMAAQALSGVAKDLTKMSSKSAIKLLVPRGQSSSLFKWVAVLTGSKNALKGAGFFVGGLLLSTLGFRTALWSMAGPLALVLLGILAGLPHEMGLAKKKPTLSRLLSKRRALNVLSAARLFLFGARDTWFVVGVPVFLVSVVGWGFTQVGTFLALWVIGYGLVQSAAPWLLRRWTGGGSPSARVAQTLAFVLAGTVALLPLGLQSGISPAPLVLGGLGAFGVIFALNSSVHSYLVLELSDRATVSADVGFYYMANAAGRLSGTLLSGLMYQAAGLTGCLWTSTVFAATAGLISLKLPAPSSRPA
jgi:predicted MFS family arabinose efflux permease